MATTIGLSIGCSTEAINIDLSEQGVLTLLAERVSGSSIATATAHISDSSLLGLVAPNVLLADDQIIAINSVPLSKSTLTSLGIESTYTANVEAAESSESYKLSFDNQGVTTTFDADAPSDFDDVEPSIGDEVDYNGFDIEWDSASSSDGTTIDIVIDGSATSYSSDGVLSVVDHSVAFENLADDGLFSIGTTDLEYFNPGTITVTITRTKVVSQKLGFSTGTLTFSITKTITLNLVDVEA